MKLIDNNMLVSLREKANASDRKRSNINFHDNYDAKVQRLFIHMDYNSYVRPHFHPESYKWEFFLVVEGALDFLLFDAAGKLEQRICLNAQGDVRGLEIPPNQWHCTLAHKCGATFLEVKEGPYVVASDKNFASWAPPEGDQAVRGFMQKLRHLKTGERFFA
jgi:cupin fold WbuC family metalloprotein